MLATLSRSVSASSTLVGPQIIASPPVIVSGQNSTLTTISSFSGGTPSYQCEWFHKSPGASFWKNLSSPFSCTVGSQPWTSTGVLSINGNWSFLLQVTDNSSTPQTVNSKPVYVMVNPALSVPALALSPVMIDIGQTVTVTAKVTWSGGTPTYSVTLYSGTSGTCSSDTTVVGTPTEVTGTSTTFSFIPTSSMSSTTYYCAKVTDSLESSKLSTSASFTVNPGLTATISPNPLQVDSGQSGTMKATPNTQTPSTGTPPYSYQWFTGSSCASGNTITGATSYQYTTVALTTTASYSVEVTDGSTGTPAASSCATVTATVNPPLAATVSPASATIDDGQSITLIANGQEGTYPYSYQWYTGSCASGTAVSGKTSSSYTALPTSTGNISVKVTDGTIGSAHENVCASAAVKVNSALSAAVPTLSPSAIDAGQTATVTAKVTWSGGTPTYSVTLYSGTSSTCSSDTTVVTVSSGSNPQTGVTGTSATFSFTAPTSSTEYCAVVTDGLTPPETGRSTAVPFTINGALTASISTSPAPPVISNGTSITLYAVPTQGTPQYFYQWYKGPACSTGDAISGKTSSSYTPNPSPPSTTSYSVNVTDSSVGTPPESVCATVTVTVGPYVPTLTLSPSPSPSVIDAGQTATVTATVAWSGGTPPYSVTLYSGTSSTCSSDTTVVTVSSGSNPQTGVTGTSATFSFTAPGYTTHYCASVTDSEVSPVTATTNVEQLTVNPVFTKPTISASPVATDSGLGSNLTATGSFAGGTPPYTCQWLKALGAGSYSFLGKRFSCTIGSYLWTSWTSPVTSSKETWSFELEVTDSSTLPNPVTVYSNAVIVTVSANPTPPTISANPVAIKPGQSSNLNTTVPFKGGTSPYTCQWLFSRNATNFAASVQLLRSNFTEGCTPTSEPSTLSPTLPVNGTWGFELKVTDAVGASVSSNLVTVTVGSLPITIVTVSCHPASMVVGSATTCKAVVKGTGSARPKGTVSWSSDSPGTFYPASESCGLLRLNKSAGWCSVRFWPSASGSVIITAYYVGDANNAPNAGPSTLAVTPETSTTSVSCSPASVPAASSRTITCKAVVKGHSPTGTVTWTTSTSGIVSISSSTCTLSSISSSKSSCSVEMTGTQPGSVMVTAGYGGDLGNGPSSGTHVLHVGKAVTTVTITCSSTSLSIGVPVTCTATVSGYSPTGTVTWGRVSGAGRVTFSSPTCSLLSGSCQVTVTATKAGSIKIKAFYGGDSDNIKSVGMLVLTIA